MMYHIHIERLPADEVNSTVLSSITSAKIKLKMICSVYTFLMSIISVSAYSSSSSSMNNLRSIPHTAPLIIGYASDAKSGKVDQAIIDGANIIIWSFIHLHISDENNGATSIETSLDLNEIKRIRNKYDHVVHMAAFGGWNGPHPPTFSDGTSLSGVEWCEVFMKFNEMNDFIFDGIDWDYEGNDNLNAPTSKFTLATLDIMADFTVRAKSRGLIVSMAPAESYLDSTVDPGSTDATFSLRLDLSPRAWTSPEDREIIGGFSYAGRQCYAYVLARAGVESFDFISIQLYEGYSPYVYEVSRKKMDPVEAILERVNGFIRGYTVNGMPMSTSDYQVKIPPSKLVIGVANGWADGVKFCKVDPKTLRDAYAITKNKYGEGFRGVMFWTINDEGDDAKSRLAHELKEELQDLPQPPLKDCDTSISL
jgi:chitinase